MSRFVYLKSVKIVAVVLALSFLLCDSSVQLSNNTTNAAVGDVAPNPDPREVEAGLGGRAPRGPRWALGGFHRTLLRPPRGSFSAPRFFFSEW